MFYRLSNENQETVSLDLIFSEPHKSAATMIADSKEATIRGLRTTDEMYTTTISQLIANESSTTYKIETTTQGKIDNA